MDFRYPEGRTARACDKKRRTKKEAQTYAKSVFHDFGVALYPYPCDICSCWHAGKTKMPFKIRVLRRGHSRRLHRQMKELNYRDVSYDAEGR